MRLKKLGYPLMILTLLISFHAGPLQPSTVSAAPLSWSEVRTPSDSGEQLQAGTDVSLFCVAPDGLTMFAYDNVFKHLYKSIDSGVTWTRNYIGGGLEGKVPVDMAISPDYTVDGTVIVATSNEVWRSINRGTTFGDVGSSGLMSLISGTTEVISSIDVANHYLGGQAFLAGLYDAGAGTGGVARFTTSSLAWIDLTSNTGWPSPADVLSVAFSPNHTTDGQVLVLAVDVSDTHIWTKFKAENWNASVAEATISGHRPTYGTMAFPADYDWQTNNKFLIGTANDASTEKDDCYKIIMAPGTTEAIDQDCNGTNTAANISSISIKGNFTGGKAVTGQWWGTSVRRTDDISVSTPIWRASTKPPTGGSNVTDYVTVAWSPTSNVAYAATNGASADSISGLFKSTDDGATWNGLALLDVSAISHLSFIDYAIADDNNMFVLMWDDADASGTATDNDKAALFKTSNAGSTWEMVWSRVSGSFSDIMKLICISPSYATDSTIFVAQNDSRLWKSTNAGQSWLALTTPTAMTALSVVDKNTYYTGHSDAFYKSGRWTSASLFGGTATSITVTLSNDILVGTNRGEVLKSIDDGRNFERVGAPNAMGDGNGMVIAIDPAYASNKIIYAGSNGAAASGHTGVGLWRWEGESSISWRQIDSGEDWDGTDNAFPGSDDKALLCSGIALAQNGTLYAASSKANQGLRRSVTPTGAAASITSFESVTAGLPAGACLSNVKLSPATNTLYSIATGVSAGSYGYASRLLAFTDTTNVTPVLSEPANQTVVTGPSMRLAWTGIDSIIPLTYRCQVSNDVDFADLFCDTTTQGTSLHVSGFSPGYTYWWRVFVDTGGPLASKKSASRTFSTAPAAAGVRGDINYDGQANALDITILERIIAGLE